MRSLRRFWPLLLLLAAVAAAYALGLQRFLSFDALARERATLRALVGTHPALTAEGYVVLYAAAVSLSLPGAAVLTTAGGLMFGTLAGAAWAVLGATCGAMALFLIARHALAPALARRAGPLLDRVRPRLERDGFAGLLALRLIPVVPFWLLNLAPALAGMRLAPFALATALGIIPGSLLYASIGAGLGDVLARGGQPDLEAVLRPAVLLPRLGLAAIALLPIAWRRWKRRPACPPHA